MMETGNKDSYYSGGQTLHTHTLVHEHSIMAGHLESIFVPEILQLSTLAYCLKNSNNESRRK